MTKGKFQERQEVKKAKDLVPDDLAMFPDDIKHLTGGVKGMVVTEVFVKETTVEIYGMSLGNLTLVELPVDYLVPLLPELI